MKGLKEILIGDKFKILAMDLESDIKSVIDKFYADNEAIATDNLLDIHANVLTVCLSDLLKTTLKYMENENDIHETIAELVLHFFKLGGEAKKERLKFLEEQKRDKDEGN